MKLIHVLVAIVLVLVGWFAWRNLPGVRTRVENTVEEYGGWTQEARESDPVGFLTYAEERLNADLEAFAASRGELAASRERARTEATRNRELIAAADELADEYRDRFRQAEDAGTWPVEFHGATYERAQFLEQVETILAERDRSAEVLATYEEVVTTAEERDSELVGRISFTRATLQQLAAQKELVRVDRLTAEADDLLAKVDELLGRNRKEIGVDGGPVRSVEDLLDAARRVPEPSSGEERALRFLRGE